MNWPDIVQALGAVASAVLAFWIARLTSRYAQSTDDMVKANQETLRVLRDELNEARDERRAPVRNVMDRFESAMSSCLSRGFETMTADELREAAPRFTFRNQELVRDVGRRDHELARLLSILFDLGSEMDRHLGLASTAKNAERTEMFDTEVSRLRNTVKSITQTIAAARDRLRRY